MYFCFIRFVVILVVVRVVEKRMYLKYYKQKEFQYREWSLISLWKGSIDEFMLGFQK